MCMGLGNTFWSLDENGYLLEVSEFGDDLVDGEGETTGGVDAEREVREVGKEEEGGAEDRAGLDVPPISLLAIIPINRYLNQRNEKHTKSKLNTKTAHYLRRNNRCPLN